MENAGVGKGGEGGTGGTGSSGERDGRERAMEQARLVDAGLREGLAMLEAAVQVSLFCALYELSFSFLSALFETSIETAPTRAWCCGG